ncbi:MAG: nucleotidyltransferase family protein [Actinomycetota bacterium]
MPSIKMATRTTNEPPRLEALREKQAEIREALARHGGSNLRVYGSVARGDAGPTSDIDLLVDMEPGRSLFDLAALHLELEDLLGHEVEIGTDVKPRLRERVLADVVPL